MVYFLLPEACSAAGESREKQEEKEKALNPNLFFVSEEMYDTRDMGSGETRI